MGWVGLRVKLTSASSRYSDSTASRRPATGFGSVSVELGSGPADLGLSSVELDSGSVDLGSCSWGELERSCEDWAMSTACKRLARHALPGTYPTRAAIWDVISASRLPSGTGIAETDQIASSIEPLWVPDASAPCARELPEGGDRTGRWSWVRVRVGARLRTRVGARARVSARGGATRRPISGARLLGARVARHIEDGPDNRLSLTLE